MPLMPVKPKPGSTKISRPIRIRPRTNSKHRQQGELADERIRPEEQHEADGRDHAGDAGARQLQLQDQADDAEHDEDEVDGRLAEELGDLFEPVVAGDAHPLAIQAIVGVQAHPANRCRPTGRRGTPRRAGAVIFRNSSGVRSRRLIFCQAGIFQFLLRNQAVFAFLRFCTRYSAKSLLSVASNKRGG